MKRQAAVEMMAGPSEPFDDLTPDDHRFDGVSQLGHLALGLLWLAFPDTVEITWERADGLEYTGVAWGYAL